MLTISFLDHFLALLSFFAIRDSTGRISVTYLTPEETIKSRNVIENKVTAIRLFIRHRHRQMEDKTT